MTREPSGDWGEWEHLRACFVSPRGDGPSARRLVPVAVRLPENRLLRLAACVALPLRIRLAERTLRRAGVTAIRRFACYPDLRDPAVVYELASDAARYSEAFLLPRVERSVARSTLARWAGCDPAAGGVVILGWEPCS